MQEVDWRLIIAFVGMASTGIILIFKAGGLNKQLKDTTETVEEHDGKINTLERDVLTIKMIKEDVAEIKHVQKGADEKREEAREAYITEITMIKTSLDFLVKRSNGGKSSLT